MQTKETLEKELNRIVATLIQEYQPQEKSSSPARREVHRWSDIDLLIIKQTRTRRFYRRAQALRGMKRNVLMDIIILMPDEVKLLSDEGSLFIKDILDKGSVLDEKDKCVV